MNKLARIIRKYIFKIDDRPIIEILKENGLVIGKGVSIQGECIIDPSHCWLITIGDNVTLAPRVHILAHDASTKRELGYTIIGKVVIKNNVFVGANTTILPNVEIGNNVIIGANSVITKSIPDNSVAVGNPAKIIKTYDDYMLQKSIKLKNRPIYDSTYLIGNISDEQKEKMKSELNDGIGFIV